MSGKNSCTEEVYVKKLPEMLLRYVKNRGGVTNAGVIDQNRRRPQVRANCLGGAVDVAVGGNVASIVANELEFVWPGR
jgi:hypothetical protein